MPLAIWIHSNPMFDPYLWSLTTNYESTYAYL